MSGFSRELVPNVALCKVYHLYILLICSIGAAPRTSWQSVGTGSFPFCSFVLGFKACKLLSLTFALQKRT